MIFVPKNWESFQHYKDRSPPWIKLHKGLIDDRTYQRLPIASRALAPMLWLLASESKDGTFDGSIEELAFRLRASEKEIEAGLSPLVKAGFFLPLDGASALLAGCTHVAVPETEAETEAEGSAAPQSAAPPVVTIPLVDGSEHPIPQGQVDEWQQAYPAVDVLQELREMRTWSVANPTNRKTPRDAFNASSPVLRSGS